MDVFEKVKIENLPRDEIKRLIVGCFLDLVAENTARFVPATSFPDLELAECDSIEEECINELLDQIERSRFDTSIHAVAEHILKNDGRSWEHLHPDRQQYLLEGVARAQIETYRHSMFRRRERLAKYQVIDPYLRKPHPWRALGASLAEVPGSQQVALGPSLSEAVSEYLHKKRKSWVPKTYNGVG